MCGHVSNGMRKRKGREALLFMLVECVWEHFDVRGDGKVFAKSIALGRGWSLFIDLTEIEFQWKTVCTLISMLLRELYDFIRTREEFATIPGLLVSSAFATNLSKFPRILVSTRALKLSSTQAWNSTLEFVNNSTWYIIMKLLCIWSSRNIFFISFSLRKHFLQCLPACLLLAFSNDVSEKYF